MDRAITDTERIEDLEEILSTMRHQLGNTVNSLKITLDVFWQNFDFFDDQKKKDYLKRGLKIIARQEEFIDAMKSYSQFDVKEQKEIAFVPFWKDLLTKASDKLKAQDIRLIHSLEIEPCLIKGDDVAIKKLITIFLDNAVEAVENADNPEIDMKALRTNDFIMILIEDNGQGIKKADLRKIFTPLFTTKEGSVGMGLPIARKLLLKMDGRMEIESLFGNGTKAKVFLKTVGTQDKGLGKNKLT